MGHLLHEHHTWLLSLARHTIDQHLGGQSDAHAQEAIPKNCTALGGCFVTLHGQGGDLRGCIGTFRMDLPIWQVVRDMAIAAATQDTRFAPLHINELSTCHIEISILSPPTPSQADAIEVGRHGLQICCGFRRGVLLPQVATEHGWDRTTFLEQVCLKAGLPKNAWQSPDTTLQVFEADVFRDEKLQK